MMVGCVHQSPKSTDKSFRGFHDSLPAREWTEAMVTGNGIQGAMVYGLPYADTLIINHALLYLPHHEPLTPVAQGEHLDEIRALMLAGEYGKASQLVVDLSHHEGWGSKRWTDPLIPAFDLIVEMEADSVLDYARSVNFETGEVSVTWTDSRGTFSRSTFVSRADNLIVTRIKSGDPSLPLTIGLAGRHLSDWWAGIDVRENSGIKSQTTNIEDDCLVFNTEFLNQWEGLIQGYRGVSRVEAKGCRLQVAGCRLQVEGAREILILTRVEPDFVGDEGSNNTERMLADVRGVEADYERLLERHVALHRELFGRSKLSLPDDSLDFGLKYDAARYNIISSTGVNPPNLQGLWSGSITPPWSADFTMNGNVPVAVSSMMPANMPELMLPLFDLLERHMDDFRLNASKLFNCRGIHVPSRMSSHGLNNHFDATWPMTFWTGGAGWYSMFYYDYFQYTLDTAFLVNRALPFMQESVLFYEDFLILQDDGRYQFNPSYSPENSPGNLPSQACINATMDVMIARQLLRNILKASEITQKNQDKVALWKKMLDRMPDYELNEAGELREWMWPGVEENHAHRHVSQLYALFEQMDPEFEAHPELMQGAQKVIAEKMKYRRADQGGVMAFGMVQMAYAAAMLGDAEACFDMLRWLSKSYWNRNMVTTHDPGALFNLDLSGGYPAVINKMLVYSEPGLISLFPALPSEMTSGSIEGILARGDVEILRLEWAPGKIRMELISGIDQNITIRWPGKMGIEERVLKVRRGKRERVTSDE